MSSETKKADSFIAKDGKFRNIEYMQISKGGEVLGTYKGVEVNGKTKSELQQMLGRDFGQKRFSLSLNTKNAFTNSAMQIRGIIIGMKKPDKKPAGDKNSLIVERIEKLQSKFDQIIPAKGLSMEDALELIKTSYQIRFDALNERIRTLVNEIDDYKRYVKELEQGQNGTSISSILSQVAQLKGLLKIKDSGGNKSKIASVTNKIPAELLNVLSEVDYSTFDKKDISNYADVLKGLITNVSKTKV